MSEYCEQLVIDTCQDIQLFMAAIICAVVFWALYKFINMFF